MSDEGGKKSGGPDFRALGEKARLGARKAAAAAGTAAAGLAGLWKKGAGRVKRLARGFPRPPAGEDAAAPAPRARGLYQKAADRTHGKRDSGDIAPVTPPAPGGEAAGAQKGRDGEAATKAGKGKRPWTRRPLVVETISAAGSLAFVALAGFFFLAFVVVAPRPPENTDLWSVNRPPSIVILDRNGEELMSRGSRYGRAVSLDELPDYLVQAILSTEDRRYFEHRGVDARGTLRALIVNLRRGGVVEGGSTITQQLARNLFLSHDRTFTRKAKEALIALWIEGRYTKEEILTFYFNRIYFGAGAYGVEAAARTYFGKSARDVTLAEAVMLAGLPKAPSSLAPTQNPFGAQARADQVLENLRDTGAVTEFEAREARANPPVISGGNGDMELGYFFDYVSAIARRHAVSRGAADGDLIITTTLDRKLQRDAEAAVKAALGADARLAGAAQAALVAFDTNGAMRAMVGGRSYVESQFNRAVQARRQPGSAFKPFVYLAALEAGMTPQSVFIDQPIDIDGWRPTNYTPGYEGRMRMTEAVAKSVNTVAVQVSERVGRERVAEAAQRMGVRSPLPPVASIALGGVNLTLDELVGAYLPLPNDGMRPAVHAIERIEAQNLEVIYERQERPPERVMTAEVAENMNHLLYQVMVSGTGAGASLGARPAAGKTGTTNEWRDAWFVGYTAQLVAGVWVGNDDYSPMERVTGGQLPARIWRDFMLAAHQGLPQRPLKGAWPAPQYGDEEELIAFYNDLARGLRDVRRDGNERRGRR